MGKLSRNRPTYALILYPGFNIRGSKTSSTLKIPMTIWKLKENKSWKLTWTCVESLSKLAIQSKTTSKLTRNYSMTPPMFREVKPQKAPKTNKNIQLPKSNTKIVSDPAADTTRGTVDCSIRLLTKSKERLNKGRRRLISWKVKGNHFCLETRLKTPGRVLRFQWVKWIWCDAYVEWCFGEVNVVFLKIVVDMILRVVVWLNLGKNT